MSWLPTLVTAEPVIEPITLDQAKAQCRASGGSGEDWAALTGYIKAARQHIENYCGIRLVQQTIEMRCSSFCDFASLADAPIQSISSIAYLDPAGATQTLAASVYQPVLYGLEPLIRLKPSQAWPALLSVPDAITVTAVAGYQVVPQTICHAMLLLIEQWYDNRAPIAVGEAVNELPNGIPALLVNYRK